MRAIDVRHLGHERVTCCWQVDDVLIDTGPAVSVDAVLDALGDEPPRALLLTHIHLDHAGAAGTLVRRWPELEVWVHERGAAHLADPSRLMASASRLYPDLDERWGAMVPIPEANLRTLAGGERLGAFIVAYTPGHASHHVSFLHEDSGVAYVGDVAGVRIGGAAYTLMPTPPPDIDVEGWRESLDTVEAWAPASLAIAHFGLFDNVGELIEAGREELAHWAQRARELDDPDAFLAEFDAHLDAHVADPALRAALRQASPPELEYGGLARYWSKLAERSSS